jgi:hypothetical protein
MSTVQEARRARARRAMIRQLKQAGAFSDATACPLAADSAIEKSVLKRMLQREVFRPGSKGGYWLDEERYSEWKRQNVVVALGMAIVMGGLVACLAIYAPDHPRHRHAAAADSTAWADSLADRGHAGEAPPP